MRQRDRAADPSDTEQRRTEEARIPSHDPPTKHSTTCKSDIYWIYDELLRLAAG